MNFLLGVFSILLAATYYHVDDSEIPRLLGKAPIILACWMVVWGALLDKLDGIAAKIMNASSGFGAQFDSLADLVAFGLAPAFLTYFYLKHEAPEWSAQHHPILFISISVYVLCAAMRLARYNDKDGDELGNYFMGMPSTFAGGFVVLALIIADDYQLFAISSHFITAMPLILIVMGLLMVSPFYLPKLVKRKTMWINYAQGGLILLGYIFGFGKIFPEFNFFILTLYPCIGIPYCLLHKEAIQPQAESQK